MIRQTIIPTGNAYTLTIPNDWIGKSVTIVYDKEWIEPEINTANKNIKPSDLFIDCRVDLSNFVFDRDKANEYE